MAEAHARADDMLSISCLDPGQDFSAAARM